MVDAENNSAIYLKFWKERRGSLAYLLRALDVRLFFVAPNIALSAIRTFGDATHKKLLKQPSVNLDQSMRTLEVSPSYRAILREVGAEVPLPRAPANLKPETGDEYNRIHLYDQPMRTLPFYFNGIVYRGKLAFREGEVDD
jgi:hypothetical protein